MLKFAIINQKGGVGKTTSTLNLASEGAKLGKRILVMDMDPQGHLTKYANVSYNNSKTIFELFEAAVNVGKIPFPNLNEFIVSHSDFDVIPANIGLARADSLIINAISRETILRRILNTIEEQYNYDVLLIDSPPTLGVLMTNILTAVDKLIIPIEATALGVDGFDMLLDVVAVIKTMTNPRLEIAGMLVTKYDKREIESRCMIEELQPYIDMGINLFDSKIPMGTIAKRGFRERAAISDLSNKSPLAKGYRALAQEVFA